VYYTTISKQYSKQAWSKISIITKRNNVLEKISSDLATVLTSSLIKVSTPITSKQIVCPSVMFSDYGTSPQSYQTQSHILPKVFLLKRPFLWMQMLSLPLKKGVKPSIKPLVPIGWEWYFPLANHAYNVSAKLSTHQLYYLASRMLYSDRSYNKNISSNETE